MRHMNKKEIAIKIKDFAINNGATDCSVNIVSEFETEVKFQNKLLESIKQADSQTVNIGIYIGNKFANYVTHDLDEKSLQKFILKAIKNTKLLVKDKYRKLPPKDLMASADDVSKDLCIFDENFDSLNIEQQKNLAESICVAAHDYSDKVIASESEIFTSKINQYVVMSNGFEAENRETIFGAVASVAVNGDNETRPEGSDWAFVRCFEDMPYMKNIGTTATTRALDKIGQTNIVSGKYKIIVQNKCATRLVGVLADAMSGSAVQQKSSFLLDKLNEKVTSSKLTLIDDPFLEKAIGSRTFDSEGLKCKRRIMIDEGVLKNYFISYYYSQKLGMKPTNGRPSNLVVKLGRKSYQGLINEMRSGVIITDFVGGNANTTTGDFSFGVSGLLVKDSKITKPISEMNISGNVLHLWQNLVEVGSDEYLFSNIRTPSLLFEDVDFSGL